MRVGTSLVWCLVVTLGTAAEGFAQQTSPQATQPDGVGNASFSRIVIEAPGFEPEVQFWSQLGAVRRDAANGVSFDFPDLTVEVTRGSGTGGTAGSVIDHVALQLPDSKVGMAHYQELGLATEPSGIVPGLFFLVSPNGVRIELAQDPALAVPVRGHHLHFFAPAPLEIQTWYSKHFGAIPGKRGNFDAANMRASATVMNLTFAQAEQPRAPTRGRVLARVGFDVADVGAAVRSLRADGVTIREVRPDSAVVVDPWGTDIELRTLRQ